MVRRTAVTDKKSALRILMIPGKDHPTDHAMLETVYAKLLPARGVHVTWIMLTGDDSQGRIPWNATQVMRIPAPATRYAGMPILRWVGWLRLLAFARSVAVAERPDVLQVRNSVTAALIAIWVRRRARARFVYQLSFPVAESLLRSAVEHRTRANTARATQARIQIRLRSWLARRADLVLAISEEMRGQLVMEGVAPDRVMTFPLGTDLPDVPARAEVRALRTHLGLRSGPIVLYFGAIGPERELGFIVEVAATVHTQRTDVQWILVGPAQQHEDDILRRSASEKGLGDVLQVLPRVARSRMPVFISLADIVVSPIPPIDLFMVSSPTKTVEALALGRPVVATPIPDQVGLIEASGGGLVAPFEVESFASALLSLLAAPDRARAMGREGMEYVRQTRSYPLLAESILERYRELVRQRPAGAAL
jgi:glycosyltransferase involved in cell wall biosynthesis